MIVDKFPVMATLNMPKIEPGRWQSYAHREVSIPTRWGPSIWCTKREIYRLKDNETVIVLQSFRNYVGDMYNFLPLKAYITLMPKRSLKWKKDLIDHFPCAPTGQFIELVDIV